MKRSGGQRRRVLPGDRAGAEEGRYALRLNLPEMPPAQLLASLRAYDLLPAIVFLPTRRRCDESATEAALTWRDDSTERREARREILRAFAAEHAEVRNHRHWNTVIRGGVAAHHAGHIPAWKLLIERLMSAGLLDAIFATATVAAGVDFPARTVVVSNIDARTGSGWRQLTASEFQQMTGRAGRRGRDQVGFIVAAPGLHQDPQRIAALLQTSPDPLQSQFRATYSTLLNLLDAYENFGQVREIVEKSFAYRDVAHRIGRFEHERAESESAIERKLKEACCDESVGAARALERLASARARLLEALPQTRAETLSRWLDETVIPGRVCGIGRNGRRFVFVTKRRGANVNGVHEDGRAASFALERIGRVYENVYALREDSPELAFVDLRDGRNQALAEPRLKETRVIENDAVNLINDAIDKLAPTHNGEDEQQQKCAEALWSVIEEAAQVERAEQRVENLRAEVWQPFERRARVLNYFGYLDFAQERVTERGKWLADLRVDRPLLVGEALQAKLFDALNEARAAGLVAALASDADRDYGELQLDDALLDLLARFEAIAYKVANEEWRQNLEPAPEINFSAAACAARWAEGAAWDDLVRETRAEEGDLVRMLSRTGEALLQIAGLRKAQPRAAQTALRAAEIILREPVR
jgi:superfamily II RNA helicase